MEKSSYGYVLVQCHICMQQLKCQVYTCIKTVLSVKTRAHVILDTHKKSGVQVLVLIFEERTIGAVKYRG